MQTVVLPTNQETTVTPFPLSWAVLCAVISFSISLIAILQHSGVNLVNLSVLADYPQAFSEYIAETIGYSFGLPVIHIALASFLKSMRNSNTRRKIFIGWAIVVVIANFSFMAWPGAPTYKPEKSVRASPSSLVKQQESPTIVTAVSARTGQFAISPVFERAGNFSHGLAPVQQGGKWGYIDKAGKMVINLQFGDASSFGANGLARVTVGGSGPEFDWKSGKSSCTGRLVTLISLA